MKTAHVKKQAVLSFYSINYFGTEVQSVMFI